MWQWARSTNSDELDRHRGRRGNRGHLDSECPLVTSNTESYTPGPDDVGKYLRATATYTDGQGEDKIPAQAVSANAVAMKDYENAAPVFPVFPDQKPDIDRGTDGPDKGDIREHGAGH